MAMSKLAKLVQLFAEGTEVSVPIPAGGHIVFWINKLNPFQEEQANQAGRIARSRAMLAVKEVGTPEHDLFQASMLSLTDEAVIAAIIEARSGELLVRADREMRHTEEWRERLEVLEHSEGPEREEERELLSKIARDASEELSARHKALEDGLREELKGLSSEDLRQHYSDTHLDAIGLNAFGRERQKQQIYLSLRECVAVASEDGEGGGGPDVVETSGVNVRLDHSGCDHSKLMLDSPDEVLMLPDAVWSRLLDAYTELTLSPTLARFTGALESSSDSPEPSASEEESTPSGPEGTSVEPDMTSSSQ